MTLNNQSEEIDVPRFKCTHCNYTSSFKHNVYRHVRNSHVSATPEKIEAPPAPQPEAAESEGGGEDYDIQELIDNKVKEILKNQKIDVSPRLRKSTLKTFMSGSRASLIAGIILGHILTNNIPVLVSLVKTLFAKNGVSGAPAPVQATQAEIMRQLMLRQQQANQAHSSNEPAPESATSSKDHLTCQS